jgi:sugar lactone lactonase YvrE
MGTLLGLLTGVCLWQTPAFAAATIESVADLGRYQPTGVAVSKQGRLFVSSPITRIHGWTVAEILPDGKMRAFPDKAWNRKWRLWPKDRHPEDHLIAAQSIFRDKNNDLWILDSAAPGQLVPVLRGPKLVQVDLKTNRVKRVYRFDDTVVPEMTFLNDVRIDTTHGYAYITDSKLGGLIVVNLASGKAHRALDSHPSTQSDTAQRLVVNGKDIRNKLGYTPWYQVDGLALDAEDRYLYYQALQGHELYRIPTQALRDERLSDLERGHSVQHVATTEPVDGILMDATGNVYLTAFTANAIKRVRPSGQIETVAQDRRIQWPDNFSLDGQGNLYFSISQMQTMPIYNGGRRTQPFQVFRIRAQDLTDPACSEGAC